MIYLSIIPVILLFLFYMLSEGLSYKEKKNLAILISIPNIIIIIFGLIMIGIQIPDLISKIRHTGAYKIYKMNDYDLNDIHIEVYYDGKKLYLPLCK